MNLPTLTLACGPYIDDTVIWVSALVFLVIKPLAYFAFIQAFRYRVSRPIPMRFRTAFGLTLLRTVLGIGLVALGGVGFIWLANFTNERSLLTWSWVYLLGERLLSWWIVGKHGAGLVGRRLTGWVISGTLLNASIDVAMWIGMFTGWMAPAGIVVGIIIFIGLLHVIGRRQSLRDRFSMPRCTACNYDLTGNLSGRCPECGHVINVSSAPPTQPIVA